MHGSVVDAAFPLDYGSGGLLPAENRMMRMTFSLLFCVAISLACSRGQGDSSKANDPAAAQEFLTALDKVGDTYDGKLILSLNKLTYDDLMNHADYFVDRVFVVDASSTDFLDNAQVNDGWVIYPVAVRTSAEDRRIARVAFRMPDNKWMKLRTLPPSQGGGGFSYYNCKLGGCDQTTMVGETTRESVTAVADERGTVMKMPVVKILAIADKHGVWRQ